MIKIEKALNSLYRKIEGVSGRFGAYRTAEEQSAIDAGKADAGVSYTKAESDARFAKKGEGGGGGDMSNYYTKAESDAKYLTSHQSLSAYRTAAQQDAIDSRFLTEHQDISGKMDRFTVGDGLSLSGGVLSLDLPVLTGQSAF